MNLTVLLKRMPELANLIFLRLRFSVTLNKVGRSDLLKFIQSSLGLIRLKFRQNRRKLDLLELMDPLRQLLQESIRPKWKDLQQRTFLRRKLVRITILLPAALIMSPKAIKEVTLLPV